MVTTESSMAESDSKQTLLIPKANDPIVTFVVYGQPQPGGSKRSFVPLDKRRISQRWPRGEPYPNGSGGAVVSTTDANEKAKPWQRIIEAAARKAYRGPLLDGQLYVEFVFVVTRPKCHFGTGRNAGKVKSSAPARPSVKPDALKLARAAEDAISGIVWTDDARITHGQYEKVYGYVACCCIRVSRDSGSGAPDWARRFCKEQVDGEDGEN